DPSQIGTEVFRLPTTCFAEDDGSITNSSRWLQWHERSAPGPGESMTDTEILGELMLRIKKLYQDEGGAFPDPILNLSWNYKRPNFPTAAELAMEYNGRALEDLTDENGQVIRRKGEQLKDFSELRADGSTACGCWIYSGAWTEEGNMMSRRDNTDPYGTGNTIGWAWAWPMNRRVLYNRASARPDGTPWAPNKAFIWWNGERWTGAAVRRCEAVHHHPDRGRTLLRSRVAERRAIPGTLRAHGVAAGPQPHEPQQPVGVPQPHRSGIRAGP